MFIPKAKHQLVLIPSFLDVLWYLNLFPHHTRIWVWEGDGTLASTMCGARSRGGKADKKGIGNERQMAHSPKQGTSLPILAERRGEKQGRGRSWWPADDFIGYSSPGASLWGVRNTLDNVGSPVSSWDRTQHWASAAPGVTPRDKQSHSLVE